MKAGASTVNRESAVIRLVCSGGMAITLDTSSYTDTAEPVDWHSSSNRDEKPRSGVVSRAMAAMTGRGRNRRQRNRDISALLSFFHLIGCMELTDHNMKQHIKASEREQQQRTIERKLKRGMSSRQVYYSNEGTDPSSIDSPEFWWWFFWFCWWIWRSRAYSCSHQFEEINFIQNGRNDQATTTTKGKCCIAQRIGPQALGW